MDTYVLHAEDRTVTGRHVKKLRTEGKTPVVLYGHGIKPRSLQVSRGELEKVYRGAGGSSVVKVILPDGEQNALIHEIQDDPTTGHHLHADLYQVRMDEKIKATVPLVLEGTAPAVRELDGTLVTNLSELEVECLPGDLPPELKVDVESLATFEDTITVADIKVPAGVEVLVEPDTNVATVQPPKTEEQLEAELAEEAPVSPEDVEEVGEGEEGAEGEEGGEEADADESGDDNKKKED